MGPPTRCLLEPRPIPLVLTRTHRPSSVTHFCLHKVHRGVAGSGLWPALSPIPGTCPRAWWRVSTLGHFCAESPLPPSLGPASSRGSNGRGPCLGSREHPLSWRPGCALGLALLPRPPLPPPPPPHPPRPHLAAFLLSASCRPSGTKPRGPGAVVKEAGGQRFWARRPTPPCSGPGSRGSPPPWLGRGALEFPRWPQVTGTQHRGSEDRGSTSSPEATARVRGHFRSRDNRKQQDHPETASEGLRVSADSRPGLRVTPHSLGGAGSQLL